MKLTRLELSGFKSFADTVALDFGEGVTSIVGPNGCGKSNVSDAVRWVLGEQSARLLRGGKMEDVIFQGSAGRRPVNLTEVSLHLDNSEGKLPIAYQEVVITRRLSRSGVSEYLLNSVPVRLRDIQDLLRGTGLGSDAGVVIEAKMIDLLLSDRAEERRSLFEEAAGIGLYRDRKHSTERRLDETQVDLQRLEDLIVEVQSQIRSLARQKGRTERHARLMEEKFAVTLTLARRKLDELAERAAGAETRHTMLSTRLPSLREQLGGATQQLEAAARERTRSEAHRTEISRQLAEVQVALSRLEGDLAVATERLAHVSERRKRDEEERSLAARRTEEARREQEAAAEELAATQAQRAAILQELESRSTAEEAVRNRLTTQRGAVRSAEELLAQRAQTLRSLEGEHAALEQELLALRTSAADAEARFDALRNELTSAESMARALAEAADRATREAVSAAERSEQSRHDVAAAREQEATERNRKRLAEEALAQLTTRRAALEELERDRVGLAPGAAALLAERQRFNGSVLGPLSDYVSADRDAAELAERLLGEWMHAVLVRDHNAVDAIRRWHSETQPGALVLLPVDGGPRVAPNGPSPLESRLRAEGPAARWVDALLSGSEVLDGRGHAHRRASGAVLLAVTAGSGGSVRRRAEIGSLDSEIVYQEDARSTVNAALAATELRLAELERVAAAALTTTDLLREAQRVAIAEREDAARLVENLTRELADQKSSRERLQERIERAEARRSEIESGVLEEQERRRVETEALERARGELTALEAEQESARETRVQSQVQDAHVGARVRATEERLDRAAQTITSADDATRSLQDDLNRLDQEHASLVEQQTQWQGRRSERARSLEGLERAASEAEAALAGAQARLGEAEAAVQGLRTELEEASTVAHQLEVELTESTGLRRSIVERVELEWRQPFDRLLEQVQLLDLDLPTLEGEALRISEALESIGPVNPLAVEEHAEETKRLSFLTAQRDDLVAARQSLLQAIKEIDGTARTLFLETFNAVQQSFQHVFQTLFGGGECQLKLANPDDPLESEIDIHAAPRGKRVQRIHLLSSGERTLVAVSLLFSIYLSKPSPFCLLDEVDAPLDDSNVGRFTALLDNFKASTQFVVITHNPRTMQAADAVYGVTMQEPGVSTIVGVRLGDREPVAASA